MSMALTNTDIDALASLIHRHGSIWIHEIGQKQEVGVLGEMIPGIRTFKKLEKLGLVIFTEEEPIDIDGEEFWFTPTVDITDEGRKAYYNAIRVTS